jgi:hypothetical protein
MHAASLPAEVFEQVGAVVDIDGTAEVVLLEADA